MVEPHINNRFCRRIKNLIAWFVKIVLPKTFLDGNNQRYCLDSG